MSTAGRVISNVPWMPTGVRGSRVAVAQPGFAARSSRTVPPISAPAANASPDNACWPTTQPRWPTTQPRVPRAWPTRPRGEPTRVREWPTRSGACGSHGEFGEHVTSLFRVTRLGQHVVALCDQLALRGEVPLALRRGVPHRGERRTEHDTGNQSDNDRQ